MLVTGAHRSGTTWVGRTLCQSGELGYVHEPFNAEQAAPWFVPRAPHWMLYVCEDNEALYLDQMRRVVELRYPLLAQTRAIRNPVELRSIAKQAALSAGHRMHRRRVLIKDPLAIFSTPWLVRRFDAHPVIVIRHPAAFASSIKRLGWRFDVRNWLDQPLLLRDLLAPFAEDIRRHEDADADLVDHAAFVWRVVHSVIDRFRREHPQWIYVRHEELADDPVRGFGELYERLQLTFGDATRRTIEVASGETNVGEVDASEIHLIRRNSRLAARTWQQRLTPDEIERVRAGVGEVGASFYEDHAWDAA